MIHVSHSRYPRKTAVGGGCRWTGYRSIRRILANGAQRIFHVSAKCTDHADRGQHEADARNSKNLLENWHREADATSVAGMTKSLTCEFRIMLLTTQRCIIISFREYNPQPFVEADIEPHVTSIDGAIMSPWVTRAALQRSVGKICYHTGFEELQPSALDVITDIAADYFAKIARTFNVYREAPRVHATGAAAETGAKWQERFTDEEVMLHCLSENGLDIESLETYAKDENERLGTKVGCHA